MSIGIGASYGLVGVSIHSTNSLGQQLHISILLKVDRNIDLKSQHFQSSWTSKVGEYLDFCNVGLDWIR